MKGLLNVLLAIAVLATGCSKVPESIKKTKNDLHSFCNAERVSSDKLLGTNGGEFNGITARSSEKSRSGKYALKLTKENPYGFEYKVRDVKKGTVITAEVWRNVESKSGAIAIGPEGHSELAVSSHNARESQNGWQKLTVMFIAEEDYDVVNIFALNFQEEPAYFDDFAVHVYRNAKKPEVGKNDRVLRIHIPASAQDSLNRFKDEALEQGVISGAQKQYVQGYVEVEGTKAPVELRLKGDWTDHLESNKVSYRIKMGSNHAFEGLRTFSIQDPKTRSFGLEWLAHQIFEEEDLLTTRYEMIPVFINGKNMGVYALEEHFDKQLLESRKRREGPIMKFDESGMWDANKHLMKTGTFINAPILESAEISVFKKGRTKRTPTLFAQFQEAQSLMEKYRQGAPNVEEYMDIESMAKYLALLEITGGKHGLTWHNQRFYFNPITQLLEPIAFDCFMEWNLLLKKKDIVLLKPGEDHEYLLTRGILKDEKLRARYAFYLEKYSNPKYLKQLKGRLKKKIKRVEKMLGYEYPNQRVSTEHFEFNSQWIQKNLVKIKQQEPELSYVAYHPKLPKDFIYQNIALKSNLEKYNTDGSAQMSLHNYHSHELEIIGYTVKGDGLGMIPITPVKLKPFGKGHSKTVRFPLKPRRIHYRAANCGDSIFKCNPEEWPKAKAKASQWNASFSGEKKQKCIWSGVMTINKGLILNNYEELVIESGTEITLGPNAFIVTHCPVQAIGTKEKPIVIRGASETSQGFVCLSSQPSKLRHVTFDNLGTMEEGNWRLTGAVTFYNAKVDIRNCTFKNNHCEDALNTIGCEVNLMYSVIENTFSDGYDADFCVGVVQGCTFKNTGNDCIDFSGSHFSLDNNEIYNSGDKGISGGEKSKLVISSSTVDGAQIAVASKDASQVIVKHINIQKADVAFAAYRKKPEYEPAYIKVNDASPNNALQFKLLEKGSKLEWKGKEYVGTKKFDIDAMYAQFKK